MCGADLWNIQDEPMDAMVTVAAAEARIEAGNEARLERKEVAQAKRFQYLRLGLALLGIVFWIVAVGGFEFTFHGIPILGVTLAGAGLACVATAVDPSGYFW